MLARDRTGLSYENLLEAALSHFGYQRNVAEGKWFHCGQRRGENILAGTYIQPDIVVYDGRKIESVFYVTHWSNSLSSKYKFWRTWEECAQQKVALPDSFIAANFVFDALPEGYPPQLLVTSNQLPIDVSRGGNLPLSLQGWYAGIGWAMLEAFDVSILFPMGYIYGMEIGTQGWHDPATTQLVQQALLSTVKPYLSRQWDLLRDIRHEALSHLSSQVVTSSRYRIGLLHLFIILRMVEKATGQAAVSIPELLDVLNDLSQNGKSLEQITGNTIFRGFTLQQLMDFFQQLAVIPVRKGDAARPMCEVNYFVSIVTKCHRLSLNKDLDLCLRDLKAHLEQPGFIDTIQRTFAHFDQAYGVGEALDDLANRRKVEEKEQFVRQMFQPVLVDPTTLADLLWQHAALMSPQRAVISDHRQNWVLEMLLYMAGLNSAEDIQTRFKLAFERSGHQLRPYAPYGGHAQTLSFLLQGRDICEQWNQVNRRRTLSPDAFRRLSWQAIAECVNLAWRERGKRIWGPNDVIRRYLENKTMRLISSDLNGFYIMIEHYLGDLCEFTFTASDDEEENVIGERVCLSWQTEVIQSMYNSRPLETWMEGVSGDGRWWIKVQSAQDGHEADKTKELAGRSRGIQMTWSHSGDPFGRDGWQFEKRTRKKMALVLDGDWSAENKKNLYEAGWDWIGDVSQLQELRNLIENGWKCIDCMPTGNKR